MYVMQAKPLSTHVIRLTASGYFYVIQPSAMKGFYLSIAYNIN